MFRAVELPDGDSLKGLRIGVPKEMNEAEGIEPGVTAAVQKAIELARELGPRWGSASFRARSTTGSPATT